jgi:hypothetical protein
MTSHERAVQIWQVLISAAHNRQTLTYEGLGALIGVPPHGLAPRLDHIMRYCAANTLPPLTVLVVGKDSGKPSEGLTTTQNTDADRERVYKHNWFSMTPMSVEKLVASEKG